MSEPLFVEPGAPVVERPKRQRPAPVKRLEKLDLLKEAGIERWYTTIEAAAFFDKTNQWMYWNLNPERANFRYAGIKQPDGSIVTKYPDGQDIPMEECTPIVPHKEGSVARFTLDDIREIAACWFRRANLTEAQLRAILKRVVIAENGGTWDEIRAIEIPEKPKLVTAKRPRKK